MSPLEARMAHLEGAYEQTTHRLASFDLRFDALDRKLELLTGTQDALRSELTASADALRRELSAKIDHTFMWTVGLLFGTWATAVATILVAIVHH